MFLNYSLNVNLFLSTIKYNVSEGKYLVLPSGELHIRDVGPEDGYKSYQCRTKHRLTGETRLSATKGRLVITGKLKTFTVLDGDAQSSHTIVKYKKIDLDLFALKKITHELIAPQKFYTFITYLYK